MLLSISILIIKHVLFINVNDMWMRDLYGAMRVLTVVDKPAEA